MLNHQQVGKPLSSDSYLELPMKRERETQGSFLQIRQQAWPMVYDLLDRLLSLTDWFATESVESLCTGLINLSSQFEGTTIVCQFCFQYLYYASHAR